MLHSIEFLRTDIGEIRMFSYDKKKRDDTHHKFQEKKQVFFNSDACNLVSVQSAMHPLDYMLRLVALEWVLQDNELLASV